MDAVRVAAFVVGILLVVYTGVSVFTTLIVPRATSSRLLRAVSRVLGKLVTLVFRRIGTYETKDRIMAVVGPLALVLLFIIWLSLLVVGFGLVLWWPGHTTLLHAMAVSGSSVFTLGVLTIGRRGAEFGEFLAAGAGLLVIALEIAYLPALYQAFNRRETEVTLLVPRAGTPAWGPEILTRAFWFKTMDELPDLYATWEAWAADVTETHTSYPTLMWFRSPAATRSWLTSLAAVLDAAALHDALCPQTAPRRARTFLMMAVRCLRALADTLAIPYDADPRPTDPVRLGVEEYREGVARLEEVGFATERAPEEAWAHFRGWRVTYEPILDALARLVMPPPTPWTLPRPNLGPVTWPEVKDRTPDNPEAIDQRA